MKRPRNGSVPGDLKSHVKKVPGRGSAYQARDFVCVRMHFAARVELKVPTAAVQRAQARQSRVTPQKSPQMRSANSEYGRIRSSSTWPFPPWKKDIPFRGASALRALGVCPVPQERRLPPRGTACMHASSCLHCTPHARRRKLYRGIPHEMSPCGYLTGYTCVKSF